VRDNITLGDPSMPDHLVVRAATLAGVMDFIRAHPSGFGAQVGEQGRNLSGGQRQAVGLARALARDPEIILLDEPTSNMDIVAEAAVQHRLLQIIADKTLVLITHRMSMLKIVNRLVVIEDGRITLDGPRDDVLHALKARKAKAGKA
jgi:ATP-binding cassette subfamily C protein LapB